MQTTNFEPIEALLQELWDRGGSDLLITTNSAPRVRVDGALRPVEGASTTTSAAAEVILAGLLDEELMEVFESRKDVDFSFSWYDRARIRGSAFYQGKRHRDVALRMIPSAIPSFRTARLAVGSRISWRYYLADSCW